MIIHNSVCVTIDGDSYRDTYVSTWTLFRYTVAMLDIVNEHNNYFNDWFEWIINRLKVPIADFSEFSAITPKKRTRTQIAEKKLRLPSQWYIPSRVSWPYWMLNIFSLLLESECGQWKYVRVRARLFSFYRLQWPNMLVCLFSVLCIEMTKWMDNGLVYHIIWANNRLSLQNNIVSTNIIYHGRYVCPLVVSIKWLCGTNFRFSHST